MKTKRSERIKELHAHLLRDWKGTYRKYPDQAIFALNDERVISAIEKRFDKKGTIKEIKSFNYDFYTGLNCICFEFAPSAGSINLSYTDAFLVLVDGNCKVVCIVDPFDPIQPNPFIPPLPKEGEQPFVLERPSIVEELTFNDEELYPLQVRSREFFKKLKAGGSRPVQTPGTAQAPPPGSSDDVIIIIATTCPYTTRTPSDYDTGYQNDDCGSEDEVVWEA